MRPFFTDNTKGRAVAFGVLFAVAALGATSLAVAQTTVLEVIALRHRTAEQVIPVLKPLLDRSGTLSGMQNQLIVRTTPANLAELKQVLATIDAQPRQLMITVRQDAMLDRARTQAEVSGRVTGGNTAVTIPGSTNAGGGTVTMQRGGDIVRGRVDGTRALDSDRHTQSLRVLEGNSAFIRAGVSVPVRAQAPVRTVVNGRVVESYDNAVEYRDVANGFYVVPRLAGDRVTLEINPQRESLATPEQNLPRGSVNIQQASTTVSGRLGEWMEVGGIVQSVSNQQSALSGSTREVSRDHRQILLKVEEVR
jgi:type II secretory pathway component GspD/PulD (secretin)